MKTKQNFILVIFAVVSFSCSTKNDSKITNKKDYDTYLNLSVNTSKIVAQKELDFWENKLQKQPSQYPYLGKIASANTMLFSSEGNIEYLVNAEQKLQKLNSKTEYKKSGSLRALARNYISQHKFKEALELVKKAEILGDNLKATQKMLFDIHLELGNYKEAESYLTKIKSFSDFDYLIRDSKWNDHMGDLDSAIHFMEKATKIAESSNNTGLKIWAYTNLADYYGHNNKIKKAYTFYLKTLKLDANNTYAKKGIAWIVYSYEKNPEEALRILNTISKENLSPIYYLLKAEIAEFDNNLTNKNKNLEFYFSAVKNKLYGNMYNQYNIKLFLEEFDKKEEALVIIKKEIQNRPTPQTYDLLAWYYFQKKDYQKALELMNSYVVNKTFAPIAKYHLAEIYKVNGFTNKALKIKKELLESTFELGPLMERRINNI
ncbi:Lipopolysaccharide assembly protein B [Polaribacter huanghezhanensis]|uniref:tetratricopeptide repeat protein n=1 Tax=Polaribacter huanghezhanensis TaxID=1354726 RepID=UPI00264A0148|nr:cell surface protein [Polaribacter huanghezhanensis]WKD84783.1 Lipopolysaccharide assembly protein B [Polaribacter huanghezhanensis]